MVCIRYFSGSRADCGHRCWQCRRWQVMAGRSGLRWLVRGSCAGRCEGTDDGRCEGCKGCERCGARSQWAWRRNARQQTGAAAIALGSEALEAEGVVAIGFDHAAIPEACLPRAARHAL